MNDQGRRGALRKLAELGLRDRSYLGHGVGHVHLGLKVNLDQTDAVQRLGLDVIDVVHRRSERPFTQRDNPAGHLLRGESAVVPDHGHNRDIDIRKNIRGRRQNRERAEDQKKQREDDEGIRPSKRKADNPHELLFSYCETASRPSRQ